ncbi:hypothetical protein [Phormidium sp. FACHB-1136]|uniref:hypothetical protein n=1 Tax=Phormidium sp. FACHB-1136 TaxID=2692848 RepID=UPI001688E7F9|nr:hypothetical protein [Phormidium sp. FACHB-1136]MBD2425396.1 hypothetical protein [Phormidium sp. FACHB-1136]
MESNERWLLPGGNTGRAPNRAALTLRQVILQDPNPTPRRGVRLSTLSEVCTCSLQGILDTVA